MIWFLFVPLVLFFVAKNLLYDSNFPEYGNDRRNFIGWFFAIAVTVFISAIISMVPVGQAALIKFKLN